MNQGICGRANSFQLGEMNKPQLRRSGLSKQKRLRPEQHSIFLGAQVAVRGLIASSKLAPSSAPFEESNHLPGSIIFKGLLHTLSNG